MPRQRIERCLSLNASCLLLSRPGGAAPAEKDMTVIPGRAKREPGISGFGFGNVGPPPGDGKSHRELGNRGVYSSPQSSCLALCCLVPGIHVSHGKYSPALCLLRSGPSKNPSDQTIMSARVSSGCLSLRYQHLLNTFDQGWSNIATYKHFNLFACFRAKQRGSNRRAIMNDSARRI
jgi:hypothetical protein